MIQVSRNIAVRTGVVGSVELGTEFCRVVLVQVTATCISIREKKP